MPSAPKGAMSRSSWEGDVMTVSLHEAITEVETAELAEFALDQDVAARCNQAAALAGHLELTAPSADRLDAYLATGDHVILVAEEGAHRFGYAVIRNTGRIRWLVVDDMAAPGLIMQAVTRIASEAVSRFGACFGRVSNPDLRAILLDIPEVVADPDDPEVLTWQ